MIKTITQVQQNILKRSCDSRKKYLDFIDTQLSAEKGRAALSCGNIAHAIAAASPQEKKFFSESQHKNIGIISAYNDMLSAHKPYFEYPEIIKSIAAKQNCSAQFAGGVPAMCDGVTQGQLGMELSLFSRDQIAQSTAIALSHNVFDGAIYLGICDKIVPGLLIAALRFGHLPSIFIPAGPMPSGIPNKEKAKVRQQFARGEVDKTVLLETESQSYHSPGTCTFYGTANTNQMLLEVMGLHLPGSSFVNPDDALRKPLTEQATRQLISICEKGNDFLPLAHLIDEKSLINAMVTLLASGGSTNLSIHLIAIASAAGFIINWDDLALLSSVTPLLARIYPNGEADINHFQQSGGCAVLFQQLLDAGLLFEDVQTISGKGLARYTKTPTLLDTDIKWIQNDTSSQNKKIIREYQDPFDTEGGIKLLKGNLGRAIIKVSAISASDRVIKAPAVIFHNQAEFEASFKAGELNQDCIVVLRFQGPSAIGMPELHKLTPALSSLQEEGYKVALVSDGRMSGASGSVAAAIHLHPEAHKQGNIAKIQTGDLILLDCNEGLLELIVPEQELNARNISKIDLSNYHKGLGREMFTLMRKHVSSAEHGASLFEFD